MKKLSILISVFFLFSGVSSCFAASARTFVLANDAAVDTVTNLMTVRLAELLRERSHGAFATEVYPSSQLGSDLLLTQACQAGDVTFVLQTTAPQATFVRAAYVFDMPNLYRDVTVARKVLDNFFPVIAPAYEAAGFKLLGFGDQHFRVTTANRRITAIDDFKDLRIRTMQNKYHMSYWKNLGAIPLPLPYSELPFSLDQGFVEAQENPLEVVVGGGFYKQQKYVIETNHILHSISIIMSKQVYDSLSPEEQKIVEDAARETALWGRAQADEREGQRLQTLREYGTEIIPLSGELRQEILKRTQATAEQIRRQAGDEIVDALLAEIADAEKNR